MQGINKDAKVRQNGTDRRPSYPGDQRVMQANRATKIWIKVAMAIAYFLCVSVAAFFLVIYYVFVWNPDVTHPTSTDNIGTSSTATACPSTL